MNQGLRQDIDEAIANVKASFAEKNYKTVIPVELKVVEPQTTAESLRSKLGRVSSNSSKTKDKPNRNTNIYLVCKAINGLVLQPGEQFDFNGVVGQRTPEKGYKEAPGILDGASNLEYGGGGTFIAIGWPGCWKADFRSGQAGVVTVKAGQNPFIDRPRETVVHIRLSDGTLLAEVTVVQNSEKKPAPVE